MNKPFVLCFDKYRATKLSVKKRPTEIVSNAFEQVEEGVRLDVEEYYVPKPSPLNAIWREVSE